MPPQEECYSLFAFPDRERGGVAEQVQIHAAGFTSQVEQMLRLHGESPVETDGLGQRQPYL